MRFSKPVMVVPEPPRWSTIAVITQLSSLGFVPAYLPLLLSNLSLRSSFTLSSRSPSRSLFLPPFLFSSYLSLFRFFSSSRRLLSRWRSLAPSAVSSSFLPRSDLPLALLRPPPSSRSIINPSIPSRSFHPHIIRACTHARSSGWFDFVPPLDARARRVEL